MSETEEERPVSDNTAKSVRGEREREREKEKKTATCEREEGRGTTR